MDLTGITNVGEFYSHHYLDALLESDLRGLFAQWRAEDEATPDKRLARCAPAFFAAKSEARKQRRLADRYPASHCLHVDLLEALGYAYDRQTVYLLDGSPLPLLTGLRRDNHPFLWIAETPFADDEDASPLAHPLLVEQFPDGGEPTDGRRPATLRETPSSTGVDFALPWEERIGAIFTAAEPPRWLILLAGRSVYLADRTKWSQGKYLLFDLDEILGRRQNETLRAAAALLSRDALCPDDGVPIHETLDESSHKHAYAVSTDLKDGVRRAVELLANEYVWYVREVRKTQLFGDDALARSLRDECLLYLYRLLFLFYAEARSGELGLVPMKSEAYRTAYSLESLRDLEQVNLNSPKAQAGYYFHQSLEQLFRLVNEGFQPETQPGLLSQNSGGQSSGGQGFYNYGFQMTGLHSRLFGPEATPLLATVRFRNLVLQEVIQLLSLSAEGRGRNSSRGRISYAQLGINQLGAVYEGLLSYSGFFAQETLFEVKPAGSDPAKEDVQSYFVPFDDLERYTADEFVYESGPAGREAGSEEGSRRRKRYEKGQFIFRLAGRDREKSASYYTPESLTRCVVKYSLRELLADKSADEILELTICEPAMGSGAFLNEAVEQLADGYLARKQAETGQAIAPDAYRTEKQKVKAYLAQNNAYGVDLNPTAVELARVSLWLNTLYPDAPAPWYGARLAVGNSLIGARREYYRAVDVKSGDYAQQPPTPLPLSGNRAGSRADSPRPADAIYHFFLPDKRGMAAFDSDKVIAGLAPDGVAAIKAWRRGFNAKFSPSEVRLLQQFSARVDLLWQQHLADRQAILARTAQAVDVWRGERGDRGPQIADDVLNPGMAQSPSHPITQSPSPSLPIGAKESSLARLHAPTSAYRSLKLVLDYWCSLWFWPLERAGELPSRQEFLADLAALLPPEEAQAEATQNVLTEQRTLYDGWQDDLDPQLLGPQPGLLDSRRSLRTPQVDVDALCRQRPRLALAAELAARHRFHHWELAFPEVFAERGGFDLLVGNPPWVQLSFDEKGVLSDFNPLLDLRKVNAAGVSREALRMTKEPAVGEAYISEYEEQTGIKSYLTAVQNYPLLAGKSNLYKCFITQAWAIGSPQGVAGFLHPEGVYDDPNGGSLRAKLYPRLAAHFQFHNELNLFAEVHHQTMYSVNVYRSGNAENVGFDHLVNLFHPSTVDRCYSHDGAGAVPGMRDEADNWEVRGHARRIVRVDGERLALFASLYDTAGTPAVEARLPSVHSEQVVQVLDRFAEQPQTLANLEGRYYASQFWNETNAQKDGTIRRETRYPDSLDEWILSGPHFHVATPFNKTPNEECKHNLDYSDIDLTAIPDDYLPRTNYVPACGMEEYRRRVPKWNGVPITRFYRHVHREMIGSTSERTLIPAIIPPKASYVHTVLGIAFDRHATMADFSAFCSSIVADFFIKSTGAGHANMSYMATMPIPSGPAIPAMRVRTLRLNCLTVHYADLWQELYAPAFRADGWTQTDDRLGFWSALTPHWQRDVALRTPFERRQALVEIDVLAALALGLSLDELLTIYRVQFPVLRKYERRKRFDQRGMEVPMKTVRGELVVDESKPEFAEMVEPFTGVDREGDYAQAWAVFGERLGMG